MESTNPQCYQRDEDEDEESLENRQLMSDRDGGGPGSPSYMNRGAQNPDTMRVSGILWLSISLQ